MRLMSKQVFKDIKRIERKLRKAAIDVKEDTEEKISEVGHIGFNFAINLAPEYLGNLKAAMRLEFPSLNEALIISSQPIGDIIPTHIMFDTGLITELGPNFPRVESSLGYMQQTAIFLRQEFMRRLGLAIHHSIEKVGKHG